MKITYKLLFVSAFFFTALVCNAQSVGIGTDTPDNGAILDIVSTDL